jgi:thiol-disulfide isomerase/thioredoxin
MALTESTMVGLGTTAPDFQLPDAVSGKTISLHSFVADKALLVMFVCRHCPYVQHVKHELGRLGQDYAGKSLGILAISSNDVAEFPDDAPDKMREMAVELGFRFPFCYDENQQTAKAYTAACTPDFFLFDQKRRLVYRGQLDDSRPDSPKPVTGRDLRAAMDAALAGQAVHSDQKPSLGCNIKWKPGNEPPYYK